MKAKKTLMIAAVIAALGAGSVGIGTTLAAEAGRKDPAFVDELVSAIAEKFDLDEDAVREVFEQEAEERREERRDMREQAFAERVANAVEAGDLTQEQADLILAKHEEMRAYMESLGDMDPEDRRDAVKEKMAELKDWAEENDIPMEFLRMGPGPRGLHAPGHAGQNGFQRPGLAR